MDDWRDSQRNKEAADANIIRNGSGAIPRRPGQRFIPEKPNTRTDAFRKWRNEKRFKNNTTSDKKSIEGNNLNNLQIHFSQKETDRNKCEKRDKQAFALSHLPLQKRTANEFFIGFNFLQQTLQKEPADILVVLQDKKKEFDKFYKSPMKPDIIVLAVKLLSKICDTGFTEFLSFICNSEFIKNLQLYVINLAVQHESKQNMNSSYYQDMNSFWSSLINLFNNILLLLPNTACSRLYEIVHACNISIQTPNNQAKIYPKILKEFDDFIKKFNYTFEEHQRKKEQIKEENYIDYEEPPENFRSLGIYPNPADILSNEKPFLRPNIKEGSYVSVEHYLDVQFRLLREDFISPMREGVQELLNNNNEGKRKNNKSSIHVYKNVKFVSRYLSKSAVGILVDFKADRLQSAKSMKNKTNWEQSKRFLFGSLLCFTSNKFQSLIFGTVVERDIKLLMDGYLVVQLCEEFSHLEDQLFRSQDIHWMVESEIYFEPYFHVLKALKRLAEHNFPMQKYLVNVQCESNRPKYLQEGKIYTHHHLEINVTDFKQWPDAEKLELNDSQYKAVQLALTNEFSIIQGPPGTGKTYIALKVASILLRNIRDKQMLIVCYTNHALDQFLEDLELIKENKCIIADWDAKVFPECLNEPKKYFNRFVYWLLDIDEREITNFDINRSHPNLVDDNINYEEIEGLGKEDYFDTMRETRIFDDDLLIDISGVSMNLEVFVNEKSLLSNIQALRKKMETLFPLDDHNEMIKYTEIIREYNEKLLIYNKFTECMREFSNGTLGNMSNIPIIARKGLRCNREEKWSLYKYFKNKMKTKIEHEITHLSAQIQNLKKQHAEICQIDDIAILQEAKVIGMTTTCAARLQASLNVLKIPIVIIEEAAEVPESHIIVSLTQHCEHLILIGDHLQLKPSTAAYKLCRYYNLDISLFERMLNNKMNCVQLNVQHRMRPEIASLVCPNIYEDLQNHESVLEYPEVVGVTKSLYFIKHNVFEDQLNDDDNVTKKNSFEAALIVRLCRYLCLQGYDPTKITILTTYLGQMFLIKSLIRRENLLEDVKVTVVDNFQGEENEIILLSLVRSNSEAKIGFLKTENRVCVALSRAKIGFYIIGNMDNLVASSKIWPKINDSLEKINCVGPHLTLRCQIHIDEFTTISCAEDFNKAPEGGCSRICRSLIPCGHYCNSVCHVLDREHQKYKCKEPCTRLCKRQHMCRNLCSEECSSCRVQVLKKLKCGHEAMMACGQKRDLYVCRENSN
ncbi:NFX1-type zinc finger-containing protein 1-like [Ctenocephalides felis]|uniref:NFX1-type zinc finger-containing protein 1-like n=1 Tax=Ctenocephalides felis TaxID=7515 RepID=UPI000E6E14F7|nr:NFX1-type zinc finger-containing protein 1-like [Ctenocephalides felis]